MRPLLFPSTVPSFLQLSPVDVWNRGHGFLARQNKPVQVGVVRLEALDLSILVNEFVEAFPFSSTESA